jgi:hypothetical protein
MAYIPTAVTGLALNGQTYVLPIYGTIAAPAPSTTYYVGLGGIIQTSTSYQQLIAPAKGFVRYVKINSNCTVGTSASSTELYLTHINPAPDVDYTIATDLLTNAVDATRGKYWPLDTIAGLLPCYLQAGESLLIKVVTPAWGGGAANPTNWVISGYVVIQEP